jgi:hypothetical protein
MTPEEQKFIADAETFKRGFAAALRWLERDYREDALSDASLSGQNYDDSYLMDMAAIRSARRLLSA